MNILLNNDNFWLKHTVMFLCKTIVFKLKRTPINCQFQNRDLQYKKIQLTVCLAISQMISVKLNQSKC